MNDAPEILFERRGAAGLITLNRPMALNAVTHGMVKALRAQLEAWAIDETVTRIVVTGAGEKAFSAGGDIRRLYEMGRAGKIDECLSFFRDEYSLNEYIRNYPKPYVSLIDGMVMGGGVGLSVHGSYRVAGDKYSFAMPEVSIGFFPDVGATWFLPRMPGETGAYCALTGERFDAADGVALGLATHRIPSERTAAVLEALEAGQSVHAVLSTFAQPAGEGPVTGRKAIIDRLFAGQSVEAILAALDAAAESANSDSDWAAKVAALMRMKSPLSLKLALAQVRRGGQWDFAACMKAEFNIVTRVMLGNDFYEGVRAVIVDKDNSPRWMPATLAGVPDAEVDRHFLPAAADQA